jgi:hypothetical protein
MDISASLSVEVFGAGLFSVHLSGHLEGPTRWHVKGHGSITLLFFEIDVDVNKTWGDSRDTDLPSIKVLPLLGEELGKTEVWRSALPDTSKLLVTLRQFDSDEESGLVLHPLGRLRVSQRALPLGMHLDKIGNRKPSDVNRLSVSVADTGLARLDDTHELFAPAQFVDYSDADRLSRPAFERYLSGMELGPAGADTRTSALTKRIVRYEETIIDNNFKRFYRRFSGFPGNGLFVLFLDGNSAARASISATTKRQVVPDREGIVATEETYTVAFQADNHAYAAAGAATFTSAARAHEYLAQQVAADPALADDLHVIPASEVMA